MTPTTRPAAALPLATLALLLVGALVAIAAHRADAVRTTVVSGHLTSAITPTSVGGSALDYSFLKRNLDGRPARWNPCQPIHWRVNATGAPVDGGQHIAEALRRITVATGITFVRDGRTTILPDGKTFSGWGTTQIVIGYATATQRPALGGTVVGMGGAQYQWINNRWQIAKGYVLLDRIDLAKKKAGWGLNSQGSVYMHELGHAMGLGHALALPQVMHGRGSTVATATWQRGDLAGLAKLGRKAGCL